MLTELILMKIAFTSNNEQSHAFKIWQTQIHIAMWSLCTVDIEHITYLVMTLTMQTTEINEHTLVQTDSQGA